MAARNRETGLAALEKTPPSAAALPDLQAQGEKSKSKHSIRVIAGFWQLLRDAFTRAFPETALCKAHRRRNEPAVIVDSARIPRYCEMFGTTIWRRMPVLFAGGFSFANFLMDVLTVFAFLVWFWLAISVFGDLFRRSD